MAYDIALAERMRPCLLPRAGITEKNMFGGIGFLLYGNMCCGIWKNLLVIRLSHEAAAGALTKPHVRVMDITGRPMKGWILVEPAGYREDRDMYEWIESAVTFVTSLPKK